MPESQFVPVTVQNYHVATTSHTITAAGGSSVKIFTVESATDLSISAIIPTAYDTKGSVYKPNFKHDLFKVSFENSSSGLKMQQQSYDVEALIKLGDSGRFPGLYLPKGSIVNVIVSHEPKALPAEGLFNPPVTFEFAFFAAKMNLVPNPNFRA